MVQTKIIVPTFRSSWVVSILSRKCSIEIGIACFGNPNINNY